MLEKENEGKKSGWEILKDIRNLTKEIAKESGIKPWQLVGVVLVMGFGNAVHNIIRHPKRTYIDFKEALKK